MQEVCIVIPCFNEAHRLRSRDLSAYLESSPRAEICLVDDGSTDRTLDLLRTVQRRDPDRVRVLGLARNEGKAEAVRAGVLHVASLARFPFIGYWDADLSTPLDEVEHLLAALRADGACQLALGSRVKRLGSSIERQPARHALGRVFAACASGVLGVSVYDSQCGAKIFRAEVVPTLFHDPFLTRWLFDLEMLVRLRNQGGTSATENTIEVPLRSWREMGDSKLRVRDMIRVPFELLRIRTHYQSR
jgi:glycosyltransferase involved in cell wall biosynthesis